MAIVTPGTGLCLHGVLCSSKVEIFKENFTECLWELKCVSRVSKLQVPCGLQQTSHLSCLSSENKDSSFFLTFCWPCISVYLYQYLTNLMHRICFTISFISCLYTYRCDDTRGCVMQFWPPDDERMCSKHVEAWNKTYCETNFVHQVG